MTYLDRAALVDRITGTDLEQRLALPDAEERLTVAVGDANSTVDLFVGARYPLPLQTIPPVLTRIAAVIALVYFAQATGGATEAETEQQTAALALLRQVASGSVSLAESGPVANSGGATLTSSPRIMTRDGLGRVL